MYSAPVVVYIALYKLSDLHYITWPCNALVLFLASVLKASVLFVYYCKTLVLYMKMWKWDVNSVVLLY